MSSSEYIRIANSEKTFGQKNLLHSQLDLLNMAKRYEEYKKIRDEEIKLKIALRAKLKETLDKMDELDKILPKTTIKKEEKDEILGELTRKDRFQLEIELDKIKEKLLLLQ